MKFTYEYYNKKWKIFISSQRGAEMVEFRKKYRKKDLVKMVKEAKEELGKDAILDDYKNYLEVMY